MTSLVVGDSALGSSGPAPGHSLGTQPSIDRGSEQRPERARERTYQPIAPLSHTYRRSASPDHITDLGRACDGTGKLVAVVEFGSLISRKSISNATSLLCGNLEADVAALQPV